MKRTLATLLITLTLTSTLGAKAHAGIAIMSGGFIGGALVASDNPYSQAPVGMTFSGAVVGAFIASIAGGSVLLIVLDDEQGTGDFLPTVPQYIFQEIEYLAEHKYSSLDEETKRMTKEVVFSDKEVDELFHSLDRRTSDKDRKQLREILTKEILK